MWVYDVSSYKDLEEEIPKLTVRSAQEIISFDYAAFLVITAKVDVRLFKDVFSLTVLSLHGGLFINLDYHWLHRVIPTGNAALGPDATQQCAGQCVQQRYLHQCCKRC